MSPRQDPPGPPADHRVAIPRRRLLRIPRENAPADYWIRVRRPAMACTFEVTLSGEQAAYLPAVAEASGRHARLTTYRDHSRLSDLNRRVALVPLGPPVRRGTAACRPGRGTRVPASVRV